MGRTLRLVQGGASEKHDSSPARGRGEAHVAKDAAPGSRLGTDPQDPPALRAGGDSASSSDALAPERPLRAGDMVDRYRVEHMIAAGGMARVYRAVHVFTGGTRALKVMRTRYARHPDLIDRFQKEAMALEQIRHPNVVSIENGGLTERGEVFIAMELLEGRTLREVLVARRRLPVGEALSILAMVADGVAAAHDIGVLHRDLKPENIFCTTQGGVKVLDLGLAKFIGYDAKETDPASAALIGTAAYIAPERLDGLPADPRSDVYSLGLIAYECLAGFHPLVPDGCWPSREEIALRQLTFHPRALRDLPRELWDFVARAIHKDVERRFSSMAELAAELHRLQHLFGEQGKQNLADSKLEANSASAGKSAVPHSDRRDTRLARRIVAHPLVLGAMLGVVGAIALFAWQRSRRLPAPVVRDSGAVERPVEPPRSRLADRTPSSTPALPRASSLPTPSAAVSIPVIHPTRSAIPADARDVSPNATAPPAVSASARSKAVAGMPHPRSGGPTSAPTIKPTEQQLEVLEDTSSRRPSTTPSGGGTIVDYE